MQRFFVNFIARLPLADKTVLLEGGRCRVIRGSVHGRALVELAELAKEYGIDTACIHAQTAGRGHVIKIVGIPRSLHQRFRNVWSANAI